MPLYRLYRMHKRCWCFQHIDIHPQFTVNAESLIVLKGCHVVLLLMLPTLLQHFSHFKCVFGIWICLCKSSTRLPKMNFTTIATNHSYKVIFCVSCMCVYENVLAFVQNKFTHTMTAIKTNIKMKRIPSICPFHSNCFSYCGVIYLPLCANFCLMSNASKDTAKCVKIIR